MSARRLAAGLAAQPSAGSAGSEAVPPMAAEVAWPSAPPVPAFQTKTRTSTVSTPNAAKREAGGGMRRAKCCAAGASQ
eukprot:scaffold1500_cov100-Isochrysis_galbana.AAC.1